nr:MAG: attachment glycoprotein [Longquan rodent jeilongvirus 2]
MSQLAAHNLVMSNFYGTHQGDLNGSRKEDTQGGLGMIRYVSMIVGLLSLFTIIALNVTNIIYMTESGGTMQSIKSAQDSIGGSVKEMSGTLIEDIKPKTDLINTMVSYNIPSQLTMIHQLIRNDVLKQCTPTFLFNNTICPVAENPTHSRYFEEVNLDSISECGKSGGQLSVLNSIEFVEYPSFAPTSTKPDSCVRLPSFSLSTTIYAYTHTIMGHGCSELDIGDHYFAIGRISDSGNDVPNLETVSSWFINDKINRRSCTVAAGNTEAWMGCVIMTETFQDDLNSVDTGKITISYLDVFGRKKEWIYTRSEILYDYTYTSVYFSVGSGMVIGDTVYFLIWGSLMAPIEVTAYCEAPGCSNYDQRMCNEAQRPSAFGGRQMVNGLLRFKTDGVGKPSINVRTLMPSQIPFGSEGRLMYSSITKIPYIYIRSTSWHSLPLIGVLSLGPALGISWTEQTAVSRPGEYPCGASNRCPRTCVTGVYTDLFPLGSRFEYAATAYLNAEIYRVNPTIAVVNKTSRVYYKTVTTSSQRAGYTTTTCFVFKLRIWCLSVIELSPGTMTSYEPVPFLYQLDLGCSYPEENKTLPFSGEGGVYKLGRYSSIREECFFENVEGKYYFVVSVPYAIQAYEVRNLQDDRVQHVALYVVDICAPFLNAFKRLQPSSRSLSTINIGNWQFRPVNVPRGIRIDIQKTQPDPLDHTLQSPEDPGSSIFPGNSLGKLESSYCENIYRLQNGSLLRQLTLTDSHGINIKEQNVYNPGDPPHFGNDAVTLKQDSSSRTTTQTPRMVSDKFPGIYSSTQAITLNRSTATQEVQSTTSWPNDTVAITHHPNDDQHIEPATHSKDTSTDITKFLDNSTIKKGGVDPTSAFTHVPDTTEVRGGNTTNLVNHDHTTTEQNNDPLGSTKRDQDTYTSPTTGWHEYTTDVNPALRKTIEQNKITTIPTEGHHDLENGTSRSWATAPSTTDERATTPRPGIDGHTSTVAEIKTSKPGGLAPEDEITHQPRPPTTATPPRPMGPTQTTKGDTPSETQATEPEEISRGTNETNTPETPNTNKKGLHAEDEGNTQDTTTDTIETAQPTQTAKSTSWTPQDSHTTHDPRTRAPKTATPTVPANPEGNHTRITETSPEMGQTDSTYTPTRTTPSPVQNPQKTSTPATTSSDRIPFITTRATDGQPANHTSPERHTTPLKIPTTEPKEPTSTTESIDGITAPTYSTGQDTYESPQSAKFHSDITTHRDMTSPVDKPTAMNATTAADITDHSYAETTPAAQADTNTPLNSEDEILTSEINISQQATTQRTNNTSAILTPESHTIKKPSSEPDISTIPQHNQFKAIQEETQTVSWEEGTTSQRVLIYDGEQHIRLVKLRTNREAGPGVLTEMLNGDYQSQPLSRSVANLDIMIHSRQATKSPSTGYVNQYPSYQFGTLGHLCGGYVSKTVDNIHLSTEGKPRIDDQLAASTLPAYVYICTNTTDEYFNLYLDIEGVREAAFDNKTRDPSIPILKHVEIESDHEYVFQIPISKLELTSFVNDIRSQGYEYACTTVEVCGYPIVVTQKEGSTIMYYFQYDPNFSVMYNSAPMSLESICEVVLSNYRRTGGEHTVYNPIYAFGNGMILHPLSDKHYKSWTTRNTFCSKKSTMGAWGYYGNDNVIQNLRISNTNSVYDPFRDRLAKAEDESADASDKESPRSLRSYVANILSNWWG